MINPFFNSGHNSVQNFVFFVSIDLQKVASTQHVVVFETTLVLLVPILHWPVIPRLFEDVQNVQNDWPLRKGQSFLQDFYSSGKHLLVQTFLTISEKLSSSEFLLRLAWIYHATSKVNHEYPRNKTSAN